MDTNQIETDLRRSDFPEAVDAIWQVWRSVPDEHEELFPELFQDAYEELIWVGTQTWWGRALRVVIFLMILALAFLVIQSGLPCDLVINCQQFDPAALVKGTSLMWLCVVVIDIVFVWFLFRRIDALYWQESHVGWISMYRSGKEYLLLEAARIARQRIYAEPDRNEREGQ